jgi:NADH:ubiquinone oxidoreductase subunit F (NADH-binding)
MVSGGLLNWPTERLHDLAVNATIILRYGLDHYRELGVPTEEGSGAVQKTLLRHLTLFEHALRPEAAEQLRQSIGGIDAGLQELSLLDAA